MKKLIAFILTVAALLTLFAGCAAEPAATDQTKAQTPSATDFSDPGSNQPTDPSVPENKDTVTIYANVPTEWATPYCWAWSADVNAFDTWPGEAMTKNGDWYTMEVPNWVENVIISNNGAPQTDDLTVTKGSDAWVVVNNIGNGSVFNAEPDLSQPTGSELETQLDTELEALISTIGSVIDTSVFERKTDALADSPDTSGSRATYMNALRGDVALTSAKVGQHEFIGGAEITIRQLMAEGWSYDYLDTDVGARNILLAGCKTPNAEMVEIHGLNSTNGTLKFKECIVDGFSAQFAEILLHDDDVSDLYINGAHVTKNTTLTQLLEAVGCPSRLVISQHYDDGEYTGGYVYLHYGNLKVTFAMSQTAITLYEVTLANH